MPYLNGFKGIALFVDGDMICRTDIAEILANFDNDEAVKVVKHNYTTKHPIKYLGAKNEDYPKKNWYRDWETDRKSTRLNSSHRL